MSAGMVDRSKALIGGALSAMLVVVLLGVGFVAGRTSSDGDDSGSGAAGPAVPAEMEGEVPMGFAHDEDGALAAAVSWLPWLLSTPVSEGPAGIDTVLAEGVEPLFRADTTSRVQFAPIAARVTEMSPNEATVEVFGPHLDGDVGDDLTGDFLSVPVTLRWDDAVGDWRISHIQDIDITLDPPFTADELDGFRMIRPSGAVLGGPIVEAVPGE